MVSGPRKMSAKKTRRIANYVTLAIVILLPLFILITRGLDSIEKTELKQKYSIIGDQKIDRIIVKKISGEAKCLDTYNNQEIIGTFEQAWTGTPDKPDLQPLFDGVRMTASKISSEEDEFNKKYLLSSCGMKPLDTPEKITRQSKHQSKALCSRSRNLSEILKEEIGDGFVVWSEDGNIIKHGYVEKNYSISCDLTVKQISKCLDKDFEKFWGFRKRNVERDLGPFYEYNFCDHPQHEEFISQVRDRWLSVNK